MLQTDPTPIYTTLVREYGVELDKDSPSRADPAVPETQPTPS
jgi:hypothetical protein